MTLFTLWPLCICWPISSALGEYVGPFPAHPGGLGRKTAQHMLHRARQLTAAASGTGLEFVKAMWGCLFAGVVAVPVCPPNPLTLQTLRDTLPHFQRILDDSGAVAILTDSQFSLVSPAVSLSRISRTLQPAVVLRSIRQNLDQCGICRHDNTQG